MSDLSDALNKLGDVIKEVALVVDEPLSRINKKVTIQEGKIKEIAALNFPPPVVAGNELETLKKLLESDEWPFAIDPEEMCDSTSEDDKNERGVEISEDLLNEYNDKKVLDYGCGEGHIIKNSKKISLGVGFDVQKLGALVWEEQIENCLLTTDFEKVKSNGPYDVVLLYDVLDHASDQNKVLDDVKSVCNKNTLVIIRCHPWCSRHGTHLYTTLNKAFVHVVFSDEELTDLGLPTSIVQPLIAPLNHYRGLFAVNGFCIKNEKIIDGKVERFFKENQLVKSRIMKRWNRDSSKEFPVFQLEQSFVDYKLMLK